jgi:glycolate oxidase iron-sulfur subunit
MSQSSIEVMKSHTSEPICDTAFITSKDKFSACVHCGMCLESCPTYDELGHEHQSPRGRVHLMKAVAQGKMAITEAFADSIFTCLDCRACETACPSGVQVGTLIEEARGRIRQAIPLTGWKKTVSRLFLRGLFPHPSRLHTSGKLLRVYQRSGLRSFIRKSGLIRMIPQHLQDMEAIMPQVTEPVLTKYPNGVPVAGQVRMKVALFTGCVMDVMFSDVHEATIRVLSRNGYEVTLPQSQSCCGALHVHAGDREEGKRLARRNIDAFLAADIEKVIVNAAGCGCALKEYSELLRDDPEYHEKAEVFVAKVEDVTKFLHDYGYREPQGVLDARITYHDACHLAHGQSIRQEPRTLLERIPGVQMVPLPDADRCCGSAGIYNVTHPQMAGNILDKKMATISEDAQLISMGNPGCMLQLAMGVAKYGRNQRIVHTVQLLDWSYQKEEQNTAAEEM